MKDVYQALRFMTMMLVSCLFFVWLGNWADGYLHTSPLFLLIFLAYAIVSNLYLLIKKAGDDHV